MLFRSEIYGLNPEDAVPGTPLRDLLQHRIANGIWAESGSGYVESRLAAIAERHHPTSNASWNVLTPRHRPPNTLEGQIVFAMKWEGVDLGILAALFKVIEPHEIAELVRTTPTGSFARRTWFLYEWLTGRELDVPDPGKVRLVNVIDTEQQVALQKGTTSPRHKVIDNLPGTRRFCPMM